MGFRDLREHLKILEDAGELIIVQNEVDQDLELSAIIRLLRKPTLFRHVKGSSMPVLGNVFADIHSLELIFGASRNQLLPNFIEMSKQLTPSKRVSWGPIKEHIVKGDQVDLTALPNIKINELDGGPYISAGIIVARDPSYGNNVSIQRLQIKNRKEMGIWIAPVFHLHHYYDRAEERGQPLEIAVVIGCDPMLYVASQVTAASDVDEYEVAGSLRGEPIELVPCETVDLEVPAAAEIVIEGLILPQRREQEGPFGEFTGYYGDAGKRQVVQVTAITHRNNAIFQTIDVGKPPSEGTFISAVPRAAGLYQALKNVVSEVQGVNLTPASGGKYHCVVSIKKRFEGEGKLALLSVLSSRVSVKHAVVVDDDIDVYNPNDVEWAIAMRSQFGIDSVVVDGTPHNLDPSAVETGRDLITKVGIDATLPLKKDFPQVCDVPKELSQQVKENWGKYGIYRGDQPVKL
jgi:2,5-furandicarboxylate decarboxylase 1